MDILKNPAKPNRALELVPVERAGDLSLFNCNPAAVSSSFMDTDPGSGRIRIILPDSDPDRHSGRADPDPTDPDRYQFQPNVFFTFFQKI